MMTREKSQQKKPSNLGGAKKECWRTGQKAKEQHLTEEHETAQPSLTMAARSSLKPLAGSGQTATVGQRGEVRLKDVEV